MRPADILFGQILPLRFIITTVYFGQFVCNVIKIELRFKIVSWKLQNITKI